MVYKDKKSNKHSSQPKELGKNGIEQLGYICKDVDLYDLIDKTKLGKSAVGKEMDSVGKWLFNHRFAEGHLWWKELKNRPFDEWQDVLSHLSSDFFTKAGLPYAFDGAIVKNNQDYVNYFGSSKFIKSSENWAMINGFEFIAGSSSLYFSIYDSINLEIGYSSDIGLATDSIFVILNLAGGVATSNPLLIITTFIKSVTLFRKSLLGLNVPSDGAFDVSTDAILGLQNQSDVNVERLLNLSQTLDFYYDDRKFELK